MYYQNIGTVIDRLEIDWFLVNNAFWGEPYITLDKEGGNTTNGLLSYRHRQHSSDDLKIRPY